MDQGTPHLIDHAALATTEFTDGEIAYRRRRGLRSLGWGELVILGLSATVVLYVVANILWRWMI
jgi:hypothetical protein